MINFCNIGRNVDKKLYTMGAQRLIKHGEGDDDQNIDEDFMYWSELFWEAAKSKYNLKGTSEIQKINVPFYLQFNDDDSQEKKKFANYLGGVESFEPDRKFKARLIPISKNIELRNDISDGNSTRHIELDISKSSLRYMTADNLGVFAKNDANLVLQLCQRLAINSPKTTLFSLQVKDNVKGFKNNFPRICSIYDAFSWYLDFTSCPRINTLKTMAAYCENEIEKDALMNILNNEMTKQQFLDDQKDYLEILLEYPSMNIPLDALIHLIPKLVAVPRYYTISSSSYKNPDTISINVVLAKALKKRNRVYKGICSIIYLL